MTTGATRAVTGDAPDGECTAHGSGPAGAKKRGEPGHNLHREAQVRGELGAVSVNSHGHGRLDMARSAGLIFWGVS